MKASQKTACGLVLALATTAGYAAAQQPPPPLPALPPPAQDQGPDESAPPARPLPPDSSALPPPAPPPPPQVIYVRPPDGSAGMSLERPPTHAPRNSLWLGGRLGILGYGGGLYENDPFSGAVETTGNLIKPGLALEADVGARLARRYIPYLALELGLTGPGRRFDGTSTSAGTGFLGLGFRYLAGDVNSVSFVSDLSFGFRRFHFSNGTGDWDATAFEIFRLGLGAEIRMSSTFTLSPLITLSGGTPTDTSGSIRFASNQADGQIGPPFSGNASIPGSLQASYYAIVVGCGAHFDLFGD